MNKGLLTAGYQESEQLCTGIPYPGIVGLRMDMYSYANMSTYPFLD